MPHPQNPNSNQTQPNKTPKPRNFLCMKFCSLILWVSAPGQFLGKGLSQLLRIFPAVPNRDSLHPGGEHMGYQRIKQKSLAVSGDQYFDTQQNHILLSSLCLQDLLANMLKLLYTWTEIHRILLFSSLVFVQTLKSLTYLQITNADLSWIIFFWCL